MNRKYILAAFSAIVMSVTGLSASDDGGSHKLSNPRTQTFREILKLQQRGMHNRAAVLFDELSHEVMSSDPEGYSILNDIIMDVTAYETSMNEYLERNPQSVMASQIRYHHAMNLFESHDFKGAGEALGNINVRNLRKNQRLEFLFIKAYCDLENRDLESAKANFAEVEKSPVLDAAFSMLEKGNPILEKYNEITGADVQVQALYRRAAPAGVPPAEVPGADGYRGGDGTRPGHRSARPLPVRRRRVPARRCAPVPGRPARSRGRR